MSKTRALNGLLALWHECHHQNIHVIFSHVNEQPMSVFEKSGFVALAGKDNFQDNIDEALERAQDLENKDVKKVC